jgi:hypothetical protein
MPNITQAQIANTVNGQASEIGVKAGNTFWYIKYGGAIIKVTHLRGQQECGSIRGGLSGATAKIETINVNHDKQRKGLGKLLAAAFYGYWSVNGATHVQLGTTDTSNGFWPHLGVSQANAVLIATAIVTVYGPLGHVTVAAN